MLLVHERKRGAGREREIHFTKGQGERGEEAIMVSSRTQYRKPPAHETDRQTETGAARRERERERERAHYPGGARQETKHRESERDTHTHTRQRRGGGGRAARTENYL